MLKKISLGIIYLGLGVSLLSPLFMDSSLFFPFITSKAFLFRIAVLIIFAAYLYLAFAFEEYRPRFSILHLSLVLFIIFAFISSLIGPNFYRSFWGDMERSEGLLMWLYLAAFFLILSATLKSGKRWHLFLDLSLIVSILVALFGLAQALGVESILPSGGRIASTIGNAAFLAAYLLLNVGFAFYLAWQKWGNRLARFYYLGAVGFLVVVMFLTETRGAVVGLAVGFLLAGLLLLVSYRHNQKVKKAGIALILVVVLASGLLFFGRNSDFVQRSNVFQRLATISPTTRTAETRLATWGAGWEGWKEKPILGWGLEQFNVVFNEHFPPIIYEDEGSVVWFDRAHNIIFDRLVMTGLVGLALFLLFFFYPIYYLLRYRLRDDEYRLPVIIFSSLLVAYFVQDLFVFESVVTFILLFFTFALIDSVFLKQAFRLRTFNSRPLSAGLLIAYLVLVIPLFIATIVNPLHANGLAGRAVASASGEQDIFAISDKFLGAIDNARYGKEEYQLRFIEYFDLQVAQAGALNPQGLELLDRVDSEAEQLLTDFGENAKNWLLVMRHYDLSYRAIPGQELDRLEKSLSYYSRLKELTPTRPHVDQEAGTVYLNMYKYLAADGEVEKAQEAAQKSEEFFRKALVLNPEVFQSNLNLFNLYLTVGDQEKLDNFLGELEDGGATFFQSEQQLRNLLSLGIGKEQYAFAARIAEKITDLDPSDPQVWIDAAVANAHAGNRERALELAEKIRGFGSDYAAETDVFIERVNSGFYENPVQ